MSFVQAENDRYDFSEIAESDNQVLVTNNLGRAILYNEIVYLGGYLGECKQYGGIAIGATGYINIESARKIRTAQISVTDTFTVGNVLYFKSGGSAAAGTLEDSAAGGAVPIGIITGEGGTGGAQTYVEFRPFLQRVDNSDLGTRMTAAEGAIVVEQAEPKIFVQKVTTGAASIAVTGLVEGDEIIDVMIIPTGASTNGTIKITDGTSDITNAMLCATDKTIARAGTIDDAKSTLPAAGAKIVCAGDSVPATKAIVVFTYIPAAV